MARQRSSIGFFGRFGRSRDLVQLDEALRALDVHPSTVAEAVKLTTVNLLKDQAIGAEAAPQAYRAAAEMLAYCILGAEPFAKAHGPLLAEAVERRIAAAIDSDGSLDAHLILLALESRIIQPSVVQRFELESSTD
jgi:hypothetical protein